jgi:hypothetical protein
MALNFSMTVLVTASLALGLASCSSSSSSAAGGDGGGGNDAPTSACNSFPAGCAAPSLTTADLTSPTVSFKTSVVPIFQVSCALSSSCHSDMTSGPSLLYLGLPATMPADPNGIIAATVSVKSQELPTMNYVTPGNLNESYLIQKVQGTICQYGSQCSSNPVPTCGDLGAGTGGMPQTSCPLADSELDTLRRWVAQGAMNN